MADDVELHPIVAELAAAMERSEDGKSVFFSTPSVERAAAKLRATDGDVVLSHLVALAVKIKRVAGEGGVAAVMSIALLVADKLGSKDAAADRLEAAGLGADAKAFLGQSTEKRAPQEPNKPAPPTVKAKRGLK
jgi:hypothetical protein